MSSPELSEQSVNLTVRNVGGIDETSVVLSDGVTALTGRNATNRTSLLQAIMAGLGSENVSLKGDADEGEVTLEFDGETYTRRLHRRNGTVDGRWVDRLGICPPALKDLKSLPGEVAGVLLDFRELVL